MTGTKFPVIRPRRKRRSSALRPSLSAPVALRLGTVDASVARDLIGQIARIACGNDGESPVLMGIRFSRIEALALDLTEILDRGEVRA